VYVVKGQLTLATLSPVLELGTGDAAYLKETMMVRSRDEDDAAYVTAGYRLGCVG
jgi:hypothetical protein